jgi:nitrite reductase/ring-hydroxylating ferredoxin subunit
MGEWIRVANTDEVSAGNGIVVEVNDKCLAVFNEIGRASCRERV